MSTAPLVFPEGFHQLERQSGLPFRWMSRRGQVTLAPRSGPAFVELWVRCHFGELAQQLALSPAGGPPQTFDLVQGWNHLSFALPSGTAAFQLETNRVLPLEFHPGDGRELAFQMREPLVQADAARHVSIVERHRARVTQLRTFLEGPADTWAAAARAIEWREGFYYPETGGGVPFRWMARRGQLVLPPHATSLYLELGVFSAFHDLTQTLQVHVGESPRVGFALDFGWNPLSLELTAEQVTLTLEVDAPYPAACHVGDQRELAVQLRAPLLHVDATRHRAVRLQQTNRVANRRELLARTLRLDSTPPKLGIDVAGRCNIKPPCVYCEWDRNKALEGANVDVPFDLAVLRSWGDLYEGSAELVSCSIGEPFMIREIDALLEAFGRAGKVLELTTNGQILTDTNIRKLVGREVHLYISVDAASAATYARLRNDRFDTLIDNLRRLIDAKGGPGQLPLVYLVFMPMRANVQEADACVALCADLQVDRLVLRPLNASEGVDLSWDRGGYHFDYQNELLPFDELVRVSGRVAEMCRLLGVPLSDQMSFGGEIGEGFAALYEEGRGQARAALAALTPVEASDAPGAETSSAPTSTDATPAPAAAQGTAPATPDEKPAARAEPCALGQERLPLCTEPWTSLYVLRRGIFPCCYGGSPIAPMGEFREAWNSELVQDLRRTLAAGRFHRYCFDSPDCPIVRKAARGHALSLGQRLQLENQRTTERWKRVGYGWPGRVYRRVKGLVLRLARRSGGSR